MAKIDLAIGFAAGMAVAYSSTAAFSWFDSVKIQEARNTAIEDAVDLVITAAFPDQMDRRAEFIRAATQYSDENDSLKCVGFPAYGCWLRSDDTVDKFAVVMVDLGDANKSSSAPAPNNG